MEKRIDDIRRALRGSLANYLTAILQLSGIAFHVVGARLFGKFAYGGYIFAWGVVEIAAKIGLLGMDKGVMKSVAMSRAVHDPISESVALATAFRSILLVSAIVTIGLILIADPLAEWRGESGFATVLEVMAFMVLPWAGMMVLVYATMATGTMRYNFMIRGVAEPLMFLMGLGIVAFFWRNGGGAALALAHVFAYSLVLLIAIVVFSRVFSLGRIKRQLLFSRPDWGLLKFSLPVAAAELLGHAMTRIDIILIGLLLNDPLLMANYGACVMISGAISYIRSAFDPILSPIVAAAKGSGDEERLRSNLRMMVRWVTMLSMTLFLSMAIFGDFLLSFWGESYRDAHLTLVILSGAHLVNTIFGLHQWPVVMSGRSGLDLGNNGLAFAINLGLNLVFIPMWGLPGAAAATLAGRVVHRGLQVFQTWVIFRIHMFSLYWFKVLVATVAAGAVEVIIRCMFATMGWACLLTAVVVGFVVFWVMIISLGLAPEDREILSQIRSGKPLSPFR